MVLSKWRCTSDFDDVEVVLIKWFKNVQRNNISLSGNILKDKALEIAKELNIENFKEIHGLSF